MNIVLLYGSLVMLVVLKCLNPYIDAGQRTIMDLKFFITIRDEKYQIYSQLKKGYDGMTGLSIGRYYVVTVP